MGVALGVKVLIIPLVQAHPLDRFRGAEPLVQLGAVADVAQLDLHESAALAGLHVLGLDRAPQAALMLDDVAGPDRVAVDLHGRCTSLDGLRRRGYSGSPRAGQPADQPSPIIARLKALTAAAGPTG